MMKRHRYILLFILVISFSFVPFVGIYSIMGGGRTPEGMVKMLLFNLPVCLMIGGFDYLLVRKLSKMPIRSNFVRLVLDIVVTTVMCVASICFLNYLFSDFSFRELLKSALPAIPWNWVVTLLIELFFYYNRQQEMEREKANYQFAALRNQINPHFLFNCLNVLASLAYIDAEKTNLFTKRLSSVYRYLLSNNDRQTVGIDEELEFVSKYMYLEQVRFGDAVKLEVTDRRGRTDGLVIPVSIQMLVENAIKHNVCTMSAPLRIDIVLNDENVTVSNNLQLRKKVATSGVGLANIRRQYASCNRDIEIRQTDRDFVVTLPVLY